MRYGIGSAIVPYCRLRQTNRAHESSKGQMPRTPSQRTPVTRRGPWELFEACASEL
jgi:hypothetical protein